MNYFINTTTLVLLLFSISASAQQEVSIDKAYIKATKKLLKNKRNCTMNVKGSNWNMGSNTIHFLDLFFFLFGEKLKLKSKKDSLIKANSYKRKNPL